MGRNLRNEFASALVLVLLLAAVGLSALLLTSTTEEGEPEDASATLTASPMSIVSNVDDEITETGTQIPKNTVTITSAPASTATDTPEPTATDNPAPAATDTPAPTATDTPAPTATDNPEPTATNTLQTDSILLLITEIARATNITATPTQPTPTITMTPTATTPPATPTAPATPGNTAVPLASTTLPPCTAPPNWTTYTVSSGNTLFSISRAVGSTVGELRTINCIPDADNITTGDMLFVPRAPNGPVQTGVPGPAAPAIAAGGFSREGCGIAASTITSPALGSRVNGLFTVSGNATLDNFQYYRLEVRPDFTNIYNFYARSETPVFAGQLGQINADLFDEGLHWVRLTVVDTTGNFIEPCAIPVIFD